MSTAPISPSEEGLKTAISSLKQEHPTLGITKLHALLLSEHPAWTVSEKRLRRILKNSDSQQQRHDQELDSGAGGETTTGGGGGGPSREPGESGTHAMYPSSTLVEGLDVVKWAKAVEVKYFDRKRGKGLVAKEPIHEGQVVWKEDPFVIAPEW
jgi:hypothetical protein